MVRPAAARPAGDLPEGRFRAAIGDLEDLAPERCPVLGLMRRAFELRASVTACDAVHVALAERPGCALLTADARLADAPGPRRGAPRLTGARGVRRR